MKVYPLIVLIFINPCFGETQVSGTIDGEDVTWGVYGSPYILVGGISLIHGAELTIHPDVEVQLSGYSIFAGMYGSFGRLLADGVNFTSTSGSLRLGSSGSALSNCVFPDGWEGLYLECKSYQEIDNCIGLELIHLIGIDDGEWETIHIRNIGVPYILDSPINLYTGSGLYFDKGVHLTLDANIDISRMTGCGFIADSIFFYEGSIQFRSARTNRTNTISNSVLNGTRLINYNPSATVTNTIFMNCQTAIEIPNTSGASVEIENVDFINCETGIINNGSGILLATNNYWGDPSGPNHSSNPGGIGAVISDNVIFSPWLHEPANIVVPLRVIGASQRNDGSQLIDIFYNLSQEPGFYYITIEVSLNGGANYLPISNATGDVSFGVAPGTGKHIVWDIGAQYPNQFSSSTKVRINAIANDTPPGAMVDIDGNVYQTVQIGNQVWMAENLKVTHYRNGDPIPTTWSSSDGAHTVYNNNINNELDTYGTLYNWAAAVDARYVAPAGWHVPSDDEWKELEIFLGMSQTQADSPGYRGTNEGSKLSGNSELWIDGALEDNSEFGSTGFAALPGGYLLWGGIYYNIGDVGYFWTSTADGNGSAWHRRFDSDGSGITRDYGRERDGFSVRCIRD